MTVVELRENSKLVRCILPKGKSVPIIRALKDELGIITASFNFARGTGRITHRDYRSRVTQTEKEVLTVIVTEDKAEEAFGFIYELAGIGEPHGGIIYQCALKGSTEYLLPDVPDEQ
jgi:nitrogen regulatory protein PII